MTPLVPALLIGLAWSLERVWNGVNRQRLSGCALLVLLLCSCLGVRLLPAHAKDDYRTAAGWAHKAQEKGGVVWWAADRAAAAYYGLETRQGEIVSSGSRQAPVVWLAHNQESKGLSNGPVPQLVVLSKEDIFDAKGGLRQWMVKNGFEQVGSAPAFTFWAPRLP